MVHRDYLMGVPSRRTAGGGRTALLAGMIMLLLAAVGSVAFLIGRGSVPHARPPAPTVAQSPAPVVRNAPVAAAPQVVAKPSVRPAMTLAPIRSADWKRIGMGCSCSFTRGIPRVEYLIAGGDDLLFLRPRGDPRICPMRKEQTQELFDGESTIECGETRVHIKSFGKVQPGFDGHSSKARLTVVDGGQSAELAGTLGCGC